MAFIVKVVEVEGCTNLVGVDEHLVRSHGNKQLNPLGQSQGEIVWHVQSLHTDGKLLL